MLLKTNHGSVIRHLLLSSAFIIPYYASADAIPGAVTPPMPLEVNPQQHVPNSVQPEIQPRFQAGADKTKQPAAVRITDDDLKNNLPLTESILNQAMIREDWDTLTSIMAFYPQMPGHDVILEGYIKGALARHHGDYHTAIATYRELIKHHPDLDYVRLEMATAMFDNRQYADAEKILKQLAATPLDIAAQRDIYLYRRSIARQSQWNFHARLGRVIDNNVNSANGDDYLYLPQRIVHISDGKARVSDDIIWIPFAKNRDSKPYRDWGTLYGFSADKENNISGNHYMTFSAGAQGEVFDRYQDYNDNTVFLNAGYKYQNARHWLSVTPQISKRWWGSASLTTTAGIGLEYGYRPSASWQLSLAETYSEQRYAPEAYRGYNGRIIVISAQAIHSFNENMVALGSVSYKKEITREQAYSSDYPYVTLAMYASLNNWIAGNASVSYGKQFYNAPYQVFANMHRNNRQYSLNTSLWKPDFRIVGMTPKLNFSYQDVSSSIRAYSRNQRQLSLTFSRDF